MRTGQESEELTQRQGSEVIIIDGQAHVDRMMPILQGSVMLERQIALMFFIQAKIQKSKSLMRYSRSPFVPVGSKLRFLRFAGIIDEDVYDDLSSLFSIRNAYAHFDVGSKPVAQAFKVIPKLHDYKFLKAIFRQYEGDEPSQLIELFLYYIEKLDKDSDRNIRKLEHKEGQIAKRARTTTTAVKKASSSALTRLKNQI
ncbi:MAG: hypothetical protein M1587_04695 [Thaumarchaeota archaeon]|nr:hypothetical protein [Nitrososphaerota archaeon]